MDKKIDTWNEDGTVSTQTIKISESPVSTYDAVSIAVQSESEDIRKELQNITSQIEIASSLNRSIFDYLLKSQYKNEKEFIEVGDKIENVYGHLSSLQDSVSDVTKIANRLTTDCNELRESIYGSNGLESRHYEDINKLHDKIGKMKYNLIIYNLAFTIIVFIFITLSFF